MQFSKMHGLGNDFMVVDAVTQNVYFSPELIRRLADRHLGVGFDQMLVVEPPYDPELDFHYRIFNADGSEVAQCGNGARCFARFVRLKGLTNKRDIRVSTQTGRMVLSVTDDDLVCVNMGEPTFDPQAVPFRAAKAEKTYIMRVAEQTVLCGVVSMGNPHCVLQVDDVKPPRWSCLGRCWKGMSASRNGPTSALCRWSAAITSSCAFTSAAPAKRRPAAAAPVRRWRWGSTGIAVRRGACRTAGRQPAYSLERAGQPAVYDRPGNPCL